MQVLSVRALALAAAAATALAAADAALTTSSASGASATTMGAVSCVFRYSMPTASNVPSEVAAAGRASAASSATSSSASGPSSPADGSAATSGSVGDGSSAAAGTVSTPDGSDSSDTSDAGDGSSASGATTTPSPSPTTKTPTATTKTPTATTATPSSTTKAPSATTSAPSATAASSGSADEESRRRLVAEAGAATSLTATVAPSAANTTATATTAPSSSSASSAASSPTSSSSWSSSSSSSSASAPSASAPPGSASNSSASTATVEFSCDAGFYSAWASMGLTCGGAALDVDAAAAQTQCLIYAGSADGSGLTDLAACVSLCRFPACANGSWDYSAADGINSDVYAGLDLLALLSAAGQGAAADAAVSQPFANLTMTSTSQCDYSSDSSFSACQCDNYVLGAPASGSAAGPAPAADGGSAYTVPQDKGLEDGDHWADGAAKTTVDKAGLASASIGTSAATVSVVAGGVMTVASGVVGGTSAGVASGVSAAASVGVTMAAVELCQFSVMINQMNVDARPRFLESMGKKMAASSFQFLPFGKTPASSSPTSSSADPSTRRRLGSSSAASGSTSAADSASGSSVAAAANAQGMDKYADLIGVQPDMLFYLTVAGVGCLIGALFLSYALAMGVASCFVNDFAAFRKKWLDKAIGVLMMILILSEYAIGATAMYQICYCIDHSSVDASLVLAVLSLLVMAFGTILFGVMVIRNNEDELRDLGTKHHFDKKFHARFGPLYDEYSFEGRFFFAPKLILSLLCGMTTGMVWIQGLWQIVVLIGLHIAFLFYLEMKQPYPTAFVQKTSSFVIIIKVSALFLSFFLLSSATSFNEDIPDDLREGVGFAIVGLQVLVLVALMIRQVYIFYRTWKLKRDGAGDGDDEDDKVGTTVVTSSNRDGVNDPFFSLAEPNRPLHNGQQQQQQHMSSRENSVVMLGDDTYGYQQQQTQTQALRGLQPPTSRRTASVVVHDTPGGYRGHEVSL